MAESSAAAILGPGRRSRILRAGLAALALALTAIALYRLARLYPYGVDLEIPLRAARRWVDGGQPYLARSFDAPPGPDLPFLYPPFVLPFVAPLLAIPREILFPAWTGLCIAAGAWSCRRLAVPWPWVPALLAWPPFAEAIIGGNVQVLLFAAFVALLWRGSDGPLAPRPRDPGRRDSPAARDGLLSVVVGAIKVSQLHAWLFVLRRRPGAAILGALVVAAIALATLPLVGLDSWFDWAGQAGRSGDPDWKPVGVPLSTIVGRGPALVVTALAFAAVLVVPVRRAGAWIGVLAILGAPSLHMFGLLFLLPAMLLVRREIALLAAALVATYTDVGLVGAVALVTVALVGAERSALLAEPRPG